MNNNYELLIQILAATTPILLSIIGWYIKRNEIIFNTNKIQKYKAQEYQYVVILYQFIYTIITPIICFIIVILSYSISLVIKSTYNFQLFFSIELYIIFIIAFYILKSDRLKNKYKKLTIITSYFKDEDRLIILNSKKSKNIIYYIAIVYFYISGFILLLNNQNSQMLSTYIIYELLIYFAFTFIMFLRFINYKTKAIIRTKTVIRMDYRRNYNCICNIILKEGFSVKINDGSVIIFYPGDISSHTVKQENLISIDIGYRIEYINNQRNYSIFNK